MAVRLSTNKDLVALPAVPDGASGTTCYKYDTPMKMERYKDMEPTTLDIARRSCQKIAAIINPKYISLK